MKELEFYGISMRDTEVFTDEVAAPRVKYAELRAKRDAAFPQQLEELVRYGPLGTPKSMEDTINAIKKSIKSVARKGFTCAMLRVRKSQSASHLSNVKYVTCSCNPKPYVPFESIDMSQLGFDEPAAIVWTAAIVDILCVRANVAMWT